MAETKSKKKGRPVLLLDGDILGLAAATLVGTVVIALGFLWRNLEGFTVAIRAGLAFLLTYVTVFLLVNLILRTALRELVEKRHAEKERRDAEKAAEKAARQAEKAASEEAGET